MKISLSILKARLRVLRQQPMAGALFRDWLLPFEVVSIVLLVALLGAVVLAHEDEGGA